MEVQKTIVLFPFENAVPQFARALGPESLQGVCDFLLFLGAIADAFLEGHSLSEDERSSGDGFEVLRLENDTILVVVGIGDLMFWKA